MNTKSIALGGMLVLALAQLGVPVSMIARREATLRDGRVFRFKTQPVDPYDAFRGRYVTVRAAENAGLMREGEACEPRQKVYAVLDEDEDGFARIKEIATERPEGNDYIAVRASGGRVAVGGKVHVRWPFGRYYMNEELAPRAEHVYREHSRRGKQDAYIAVRVRSGFAVLEELYVGGKAIADFLADE
jgi:uncharacterized membrane-anchored protein